MKRNSRSWSALGVVVCGLLVFVGPAVVRAAVVPMSLPELADRCEHAMVGTVVSTESYWDKDQTRIYTDIQLRVEEDFKGNTSAKDGILTLTELGGTVGERTMLVSDTPSFNVGERVLIFTERLTDGRLIVLGRDQAKFTLTPAPGIELDAAGNRVDRGLVAECGQITYVPPDRDLVGEVERLLVERGFMSARSEPEKPATDKSLAVMELPAEPPETTWPEPQTGEVVVTSLPLPPDVPFGGVLYSDDATRGDRACTGMLVYTQAAGTTYNIPGAGFLIGDDLNLSPGAASYSLTCYTVDVYGTGSAYNVTASLYTACPGSGGTQISGTSYSWTAVPVGATYTLTAALASPVTLPSNSVWMVLSFSTATAGWVAGYPAQMGWTADSFGKNSSGSWVCNYWFGGYPTYAYSGFRTSLYCDVPVTCQGDVQVEALNGYVSTYPLTSNLTGTSYARSMSLIRRDELACVSKQITSLSVYVQTASTRAFSSIEIRMMTTTATTLGTSWDGSGTLVWSGSKTFSSTGWNTFTLSTPFTWNSDNLIITWQGQSTGTTANPTFQASYLYPSDIRQNYATGTTLPTTMTTNTGLRAAYRLTFASSCAAPSNEVCAGAIALTNASLPYSTTRVLGCTDDVSGRPYYDAFYQFTCSSTGSYIIDMCGSAGDTALRVWSGSCGGTLVGSADDECGGLDPTLTLTLNSGTTYWIECGSFSSTGMGNSPYRFNMAVYSRPCTSMTPADANLGTIGTTVYGYSSSGSCGNGGKWVGSFTGEAGYVYHWDLCPDSPGTSSTANFDIDIKICDSSGNILSGVDGSCSVANLYRPNDFQWTCSTAGTYYVVLAPYNSYASHTCTGTSSNTFTMYYYKAAGTPTPNITGVSPGSAPAGVGSAGPSGSLVTITGTSFGSSKLSTDHMVFWQTGTNYLYNDTYIVSWNDTTITCYVPAGCSSKDCAVYKNGTWSNMYTFGVTFSFWYRWLDATVMPLTFYVNGTSSGVADAITPSRAALQTWENVANTYLDHSYKGTSTRNGGNHNDGYNDIAWRTDWTAAGYSTSTIAQTTVSLSGSTIVETDMECNAQNFTYTTNGIVAGLVDVQNLVTHEAGHGWVGLSDMYGTPDSEKTMFGTLDVTNGENKKRDLDATDTAGTQWIYPQTTAFTNDPCASAVNIASLPAYVSSKNSSPYATDDYTGSTCDGPYKNLWWKVSGTGNQMIATTCSLNTTFDTEIAVYDACGGTQIGCNDDDSGCGVSGLQSTVKWCSVYGQTYYISVGSYSLSSGTGSFELYVAETGQTTPATPTGASANPSSVCAGGATQLSCSAPGAGAVEWFTGSCGGTSVGTGNPLTVYPTSGTTYYARAQNTTSGCYSSGCSSVSVTVNPSPTAPASAASDRNNFCADDSGNISLSATGGAGTTVRWFNDSCGGTSIGTGSPLVIASPTATTTYYARWENSCGNSTCASVTVTVLPSPTAPTSAASDRNNFCADDSGNISLSATGGAGTTVRWFNDSCGGTSIGTGSPLVIASPTVTTTYYARWENTCGNSTCAPVTVTVNPLPATPTNGQVSPSYVCANGTANISASVGGGETIDWYTGSCGGTYLGTGNPLAVQPSATTTYYGVARNAGSGCASTSCVPVTVPVDTIQPSWTYTPPNISQNADAGYCTAVVTITPATATDNYDPSVTIGYVRSDNPSLTLSDPFPSGVTTTVTWTATDDCGLNRQHNQTVTITSNNKLVANVQLSPTVVTPLTRCITFDLYACPTILPVATITQEVTFVNGAATGVNLLVPCQYGYTCITARDSKHTLQRIDETFAIVGKQYAADFTGDPAGGGDWLIGGNLNDDEYIDIMDFGIFVNRWAVEYDSPGSGSPDGHTPCGWTPAPQGPYHADITGDGTVGTGDFTFISTYFLSAADLCCGTFFSPPGDGPRGPITVISVAELRARGLGELAVADLNGDGWLDEADIVAFMGGARPRPPKHVEAAPAKITEAAPLTTP